MGTEISQVRSSQRCQLKYQTGEVNRKIEIHIPPHYSNVIQSDTHSPVNLLELCKRALYETLYATAKYLTNTNFTASIYADHLFFNDKDENGNEQFNCYDDFELDKENIRSNAQITHLSDKKVNNKKRIPYYAPADVMEKYFYYLPKHIKTDICNGPISRCEYVSCKMPVFDYAHIEFCIG